MPKSVKAIIKPAVTKRQPRPVDPILADVLDRVARMTPNEIASKSQNLIGAGTIRNWRKSKVRSPLNYTLDAALSAAGFERVIRKVGQSGRIAPQMGGARQGRAQTGRSMPLQ